MKVMNCPLNGPRNISEFVWGGEVKPMPDDAKTSDRDWADYVFLENNTAGVVREWFGDWTLVEPGLVPLAEWRPDDADEPPVVTHGIIGGVARKD